MVPQISRLCFTLATSLSVVVGVFVESLTDIVLVRSPEVKASAWAQKRARLPQEAEREAW